MTSLEEKGAKMGTFACGTEFLRGREETFARGTEFLWGGEILSLREIVLDKEKNSLACKKALEKKYKYDRI